MKQRLNFKLDPIPTTIGKGYKAKMCARETVGLREILARNQSRHGIPAAAASQLVAALSVILDDVARTGCICKVDDFFTIEPHVRGRFDGVDDVFDPSRGHSVSFTLKAGRDLTHLRHELQPVNICRPFRARIANMLSMGCEKASHDRAVFGHDLSLVGTDLRLVDGDTVRWSVEVPGEAAREGAFEVLANDETRLVLKWPCAIPPSAVGHTLVCTLASRGGNPQAVRRTLVRRWPIVPNFEHRVTEARRFL